MRDDESLPKGKYGTLRSILISSYVMLYEELDRTKEGDDVDDLFHCLPMGKAIIEILLGMITFAKK